MAYSSIVKPSVYFNTLDYNGNGSNRTIIDVGFQPDWVWIKHRNGSSNHNLFDVIRGATKYIESSSTAPDQTGSDRLTGFASDGFDLGNNGGVNASGQTYVSWNWKANGVGSSNTDGDVTSTVSANTTAGFSIVKWNSTGTAGINIGHGLGQKPAMIITKCININGTSWPVYHQSLGATKYLTFNNTNAGTTSATRWNNSEPTTTTFQTGSSGDIGGSDRTMIAYCFAEKTGCSKISTYVGNGNADGSFIYTGFKPAFILSKKSSGSGTNWTIWDNKRSSSGNNPTDKILHPNVSNPDNTADDTDFLSNGFKLRATASGMNNNGDSYIYMAFAEEPLVANVGQSIPATAR